MTRKNANFVPVSALDKRVPSRRELLRDWCGRRAFVAKISAYFRNGCGGMFCGRRSWHLRGDVLRDAQWQPGLLVLHAEGAGRFSEELGTATRFDCCERFGRRAIRCPLPAESRRCAATLSKLFRRAIRLQISLGAADYEWDAAGPQGGNPGRVTGLVVSLDALAADPTNPLSKPAALRR